MSCPDNAQNRPGIDKDGGTSKPQALIADLIPLPSKEKTQSSLKLPSLNRKFPHREITRGSTLLLLDVMTGAHIETLFRGPHYTSLDYKLPSDVIHYIALLM